MKTSMKFFNNDEGVSPIVATLVLIVVAIIGAAAVGLIMGTFSSQVSDQANAGDIGATASSTITIGGSTTVFPGDVLVAKAYMKDHPGVKIVNQEGGSSAGIAGVGMGALDIGASSSPLSTADLAKYPDLQATEVAGSAVVIIVSDDLTTLTSVTKTELQVLYGVPGITGTAPTGISTVVQRAEGSGTEETIAKYLTKGTTGGEKSNFDSFTISGNNGQVGNEGVLAAVASDTDAIGFVDWGYVANGVPAGVKVLAIVDGSETYTATSAHITNQLKKTGAHLSTPDADGATHSGYVDGLVKHCYLITNGAPNTIIADFIQYALTPEGSQGYSTAGMIPAYIYV